MTGWYIWSTENFSDADDFFNVPCASHLHEVCPEILKYLGLAPGWRLTVGKQTFTVTHANNAQTDRTFFYLAIG